MIIQYLAVLPFFSDAIRSFCSFRCALNEAVHELMLIIMIPIQSARCNKTEKLSQTLKQKIEQKTWWWIVNRTSECNAYTTYQSNEKCKQWMGKNVTACRDANSFSVRFFLLYLSLFVDSYSLAGFCWFLLVAVGASYFLLLFLIPLLYALWLNYRQRGKMISFYFV